MTKSKVLSFLKLVKNEQVISRAKLQSRSYSSQDIHELISLNLIKQTEDTIAYIGGRYVEKETDLFVLTDKGIDYLDDNRYDFRKTWWPHIINAILSLTALIISLNKS